MTDDTMAIFTDDCDECLVKTHIDVQITKFEFSSFIILAENLRTKLAHLNC